MFYVIFALTFQDRLFWSCLPHFHRLNVRHCVSDGPRPVPKERGKRPEQRGWVSQLCRPVHYRPPTTTIRTPKTRIRYFIFLIVIEPIFSLLASLNKQCVCVCVYYEKQTNIADRNNLLR